MFRRGLHGFLLGWERRSKLWRQLQHPEITCCITRADHVFRDGNAAKREGTVHGRKEVTAYEVPDIQRVGLRIRSGYDFLTIRAHRAGFHRFCVSIECGKKVAAGGVPDLQRVVTRSGDDVLPYGSSASSLSTIQQVSRTRAEARSRIHRGSSASSRGSSG